MAKLESSPLYPVNLSVGGVPVNLVKNKTPQGRFQIARVLKTGSPREADFVVLWEGESESQADAFARTQVERDSPGLLSQAHPAL
ncbi:MAG: hypothetical protein WCF22_22290 [Candidatus Sulfotelmatobacter sp.]